MDFHQILWIGVGIIAIMVISTLWVEIRKEKKKEGAITSETEN